MNNYFYKNFYNKVNRIMMNYNELLVRVPHRSFLLRSILDSASDFLQPWLIIVDSPTSVLEWGNYIAKLGKKHIDYKLIIVDQFIKSSEYELLLQFEDPYNVIVDCDPTQYYKSSTFLDKIDNISERVILIDKGLNMFQMTTIEEYFSKLFKWVPDLDSLIANNLVPESRIVFFRMPLTAYTSSEKYKLDTTLTTTETLEADYKHYLKYSKQYSDINVTLKCTEQELYKVLQFKKEFYQKTYSKFLQTTKNSERNDRVRLHLKKNYWEGARKEVAMFLASAKLKRLIGVKNMLQHKKVVFFIDPALNIESQTNIPILKGMCEDSIINRETREATLRYKLTQFRQAKSPHLFINDAVLPSGLLWTEVDVVVITYPTFNLLRSLSSLLKLNTRLKVIIPFAVDTSDDRILETVVADIGEGSILETSQLAEVRKFVYEPNLTLTN